MSYQQTENSLLLLEKLNQIPIQSLVESLKEVSCIPYCFYVYVIDRIISVDPGCKLLLYADESTILFSHKDADVIVDMLGKFF